jgi:hypothetical protein
MGNMCRRIAENLSETLLEAEARQAKFGLWSRADAKPPWEWRKPAMPLTADVSGNRRKDVYHRPKCPAAVRTNDANRIRFATAAEADAAGYKQAGDCGLPVR